MIDISRRRRIAAGSGVDPADVSGLVKQFDLMAAFFKQMAQMSMLDKIRALTGLGRAAATNPIRPARRPEGRNRQAALPQGEVRNSGSNAKRRNAVGAARSGIVLRL